MMNHNSDSFKSIFQLDPDIIYLNHGSFGACPIPIFNERAKWQLELEKQPVAFIQDRIFELIDNSREKLSGYINCHKDDIVYFPNPTTALNMVIRSLNLTENDEVLTTDHEYGALDKTWNFIKRKRKCKYSIIDIKLPINESEIIQSFKDKINNKTKVIFLSHITSPTGLILPIEKICELAKGYNITTIIDGAHVPGHIDLDIQSLGVDVYTGACHKWMMCPKGVTFLYASKRIQEELDPLVVSWGWESDTPSHSQFLDYHQYQGTNDPSAYLSVPKSIDFMEEYDWKSVRAHCHQMVCDARSILLDIAQSSPICDEKYLGQMASVELDIKDDIELYKYLKSNNIEIPIIKWKERFFIRVSFQCYNSMKDIDVLSKHLNIFLNGI